MDASICSLPTDLFTIIRSFVGPSKFKPILQTYVIPHLNQITYDLCPKMIVDDIGICCFDFNQFNDGGQILLNKIVILGDFHYETMMHNYTYYSTEARFTHQNAYWTMKELLIFIAYCETITRQRTMHPDRSHVWLESIYSKTTSNHVYLQAFFGS